MKKRNLFSFIGLAVAFIFSASLFAQEKTEVIIKVKKDGKVIMDTTYQYDNAEEAKHAVKMMEILEEDEHANTMVFISEDGKKTEIKKHHGDSMVWITEEEIDGDKVKVMVIDDENGNRVTKEESEEGDGENVKVIVVKKKVDKDCEHEGDEEVEVKVEKKIIIKPKEQ